MKKNRRRRKRKSVVSNFGDSIKNLFGNIRGKKKKYILDSDLKRRNRIRNKSNDRERERIIWGLSILGSIILAFLTIKFAFEKTTVLDDSMSKTIDKNDIVLINKFAYDFSDPDRYDVVVFDQKDKKRSFYNIKRVIGLPNEKISIKKGKVYVNGEKLDEKVVVDDCKNPGLADSNVELGENEYFVLGDNRNNSEDSRFANIGVVKKDDLIGSAWLKINNFSIIKNLNVVEDNDDKENKEETKK